MKCCLLSSDVESARRLFSCVSQIASTEWHWVKDKSEAISTDFKSFEHIFVFRWPYIINEEDLKTSNFIGFHTSNLPEGKGGSPLQNQIMEGIYESKVNAIKLVPEVDGGPIYFSSPITLQGSIEDVWHTISLVAEKLIKKILLENPIPQAQPATEAKIYKRRKNNNIEKSDVKTIESLHRFIQMLDGEGYPQAFFETDDFRIELSRTSMKQGSILCDAKITLKEKI